MAKTVIEAFKEFLKNKVNLDKEQTNKARSSRDWLVEQILTFPISDNTFPEIYIEKNIFYGSFSRNIKKKPLDDIDIMICLKADGCTYNEMLTGIEINVPESAKRFLHLVNDGTNILNSRKLINSLISKLAGVPQYKKADVKRNLEAATLDLISHEWTFDIVPCFFTQEDSNNRTFYIIPDGAGNWKKTDPRIDSDKLKAINDYHNGNILNVIRIVKYWNKRSTMPSMSSYLLENFILDYYSSQTVKAQMFVDMELPDIFLHLHRSIHNVVNDPKGIQGNLNNLSFEDRNKISDKAYEDYTNAFHARKFENEKDYERSINNWRKIFGDEFPKYE